MGDMVINIPQLDFSVANKETQINEISAMLSPAAKFAQNPLTTVGLTWGFIGGRVGASGDVLVPNGTLNLPANSISFIEVKGAAISFNTVGFSSDAIPLYKVTTGASTITGYEDRRDAYTVTAAASSGGSSGGGGGGVPIGAIVAMPLSSPNIVSAGGADYVKTGSVAPVATYPLAPKSLYFAKKNIGNYATQGGCYGNGMHVVMTNGSGVLTSSDDGKTWTYRATPVLPGRIAFGAGLFVITGSGGTFYTSPDCVTWTARAAAAPTNGSWISIIFTGSMFVARSNGQQMVTSPDGLTWTARTVAIGSGWQMAHGAGMIVGVENQIGTGIAVSSTDNGVAWTQRAIAQKSAEGLSIGWKSVASNGAGLYVAVGTAYSSIYERTELYISKSTDGTTWGAPIDMLIEGNSPTITFVGGKFVLLPKVDAGFFYTAADDLDWKLHAFGFANQSGGSVSSGGGKGYFCGTSATAIGNLGVSDGSEYTETGVAIVTDAITQTPFYMRVS
jgi:hypothetical protein